jgi:hypothetical protein
MAFSINMDKAKELHINKIRQKRTELFTELDIQFMKALEQGNTILAAEIGSKKQALRDATNIDSGSISTLDDIKALWDINILGETPYI